MTSHANSKMLFRFGLLLLAMGCLVFFQADAFEKEGDGEEISVSGEVLDLSCFMASGAKGEGHKGCAEKCMANGMPIGLLGSDGKVYLLVEDHKNASPYQSLKELAAANVEVTGNYFVRNGMPGIVIKTVSEKG
ncbi:hypothetical protein [Cyclobacterium jeungdonense]|uniref:Uncharacterized protein n=1 Tax=Cyclobacterium jeungdonense TaxID=708087 RepID=A0ABT8CBC6_9BACT|nr:hypothetical protein [Cyclobacterium jeungdonense]MDN3689687.1 hypothetical protein [Cyclobacterium jeungdonense]